MADGAGEFADEARERANALQFDDIVADSENAIERRTT
jgi:hypothetical protein